MADKTKEQIALELLANKEARSAELKAKREAAREAIAGESKADAFKRIAARRVNQVMSDLITLGGVFDKNNYDYTPEQAEKAFAAIEGELAKCKARAAGEAKAKTGFGF